MDRVPVLDELPGKLVRFALAPAGAQVVVQRDLHLNARLTTCRLASQNWSCRKARRA